jgi:hypothetical protein
MTPPASAATPPPAAGALIVPPGATPPAPAPSPNPFKALAILLKSVSDSLENPNPKTPDAPPRWVRIVRVREFLPPQQKDADAIANVVSKAVGGFATGMAYIVKFTLTARDLLVQGDSAKALFEVSADLVKTISGKEFINSITAVVGGPQFGSSPLEGVGNVVDAVSAIVDKVPSPEDLDVIEAELYRMLVIEQVPVLADKAADAKAETQIDVNKTGKLRLMLWGLNDSFDLHDVVKGAAPTTITSYGTRHLWAGDVSTLPTTSAGHWSDANHPSETVFDFTYASPANKDLDELNQILKTLGYVDPDLTVNVKAFQHINEMATVNGLLDNPTINRLMGLVYNTDITKGLLKRAVAYDQAKLGTFDPKR